MSEIINLYEVDYYIYIQDPELPEKILKMSRNSKKLNAVRIINIPDDKETPCDQ